MSFHYSPKIITDGLVLYLDAANTRSYPGTGTTWSDLSRSGNNGTLVNGPTFNSLNGGSIVFDGSDDYINMNTPNFGQIYTVNLWIKLNNLLSKVWIGGNGSEYHMNFLDGRTYNRINNILFDFDTQLITNQWYNISLTRNNTSVNCYKNSILINNSTNLSYNTDFILYRIGSLPLGFYGDGSIGNVSFYNKALTDQEILQNYNATKSRFGL
jgi:hypothetical protein